MITLLNIFRIATYNERRIQKKRQHSEKKKARKTQIQPN